MDEGTPSKLPCPATVVIGTHDGTFHCDEVLSCFMLRSLAKYKHADIVRTRDPAKLAECTLVVDVGGKYCPEENRFDHHQRDFNESMQSLAKKKWTTKLSSAGLVYLHFGRQVMSELLNIDVEHKDMEKLYDTVYEGFIEEIDAVDNGVNQYDGTPKYKVSTTIGHRVGGLNPTWNSSGVDADEQFHKAMAMVGAEFIDKVQYFYNSWIPARNVVVESIHKRHEVDSSGEIMRLDQFAPWKSHLFEIEETEAVTPTIKFALFEDNSGNWRVQCVPINPSSFENRVGLLEAWRGVRDDALSQLSGISGCIFVHASGFIGGNKTYEGALRMAQISLNARPTPMST